MFGRKKKGPDKAFSHTEGCKIVEVDPGVRIEWIELERGHWRVVCRCGAEDWYELTSDRRARSARPLDKSPRRAVRVRLRNRIRQAKVLLKVKDGAAGGYRWVECNACGHGWQVPHYAERSA